MARFKFSANYLVAKAFQLLRRKSKVKLLADGLLAKAPNTATPSAVVKPAVGVISSLSNLIQIFIHQSIKSSSP